MLGAGIGHTYSSLNMAANLVATSNPRLYLVPIWFLCSNLRTSLISDPALAGMKLQPEFGGTLPRLMVSAYRTASLVTCRRLALQ